MVPFINRNALGSVAGVVGAGGNAGAGASGFLFRVESLNTEQALLILGVGVALVAPLAFLARFTVRNEAYERHAMEPCLGGACDRLCYPGASCRRLRAISACPLFSFL